MILVRKISSKKLTLQNYSKQQKLAIHIAACHNSACIVWISTCHHWTGVL